jgi:hypothetical protein
MNETTIETNGAAASAAAVEAEVAAESCEPVGRKGRSKIDGLPKAQRDVINRMLLDGANYAEVIQAMAEQGVSLNAENLSKWYQRGFQNYLAELERLEFQKARYEAATELLKDTDTIKLPEAGLQTAAAQIFDLLGRFDSTSLVEGLSNEPDKYIRLVNALARVAREAQNLKRQRALELQAVQDKDPKRKLAEEERTLILDHVDDCFGVKAYREPNPFAGMVLPNGCIPSVPYYPPGRKPEEKERGAEFASASKVPDFGGSPQGGPSSGRSTVPPPVFKNETKNTPVKPDSVPRPENGLVDGSMAQPGFDSATSECPPGFRSPESTLRIPQGSCVVCGHSARWRDNEPLPPDCEMCILRPQEPAS